MHDGTSPRLSDKAGGAVPEAVTTSLFVDGKGYAGQIIDFAPPAPLDAGQEGMETSLLLTHYCPDVLALWGVFEGARIAFIVRGGMKSDDGAVNKVEHVMHGLITAKESEPWIPGWTPPLSITVRLGCHHALPQLLLPRRHRKRRLKP